MLISAVVTVRNEAKNIAELLNSLIGQEQPFEVIVVDAFSEDETRDIVRRYAKEHPFIRLYKQGGTRGIGRNFGVEMAKGEFVAFIDGDCVAQPDWIKEMRRGTAKADVVAGRTINIGYGPYVDLGRVELYHRGVDLTYPSCNLSYRKSLFNKIGGFDPGFITAEDIDLNFRAVKEGADVYYNEKALVKAKARDDFFGFSKQAFWNGYGRKQLTLKHGRLWGKYKPTAFLGHQFSLWYFFRLGFALLGYMVAKVKEPKRQID
jgi:glycosyltransferase involved in cell wall biosynthesis